MFGIEYQIPTCLQRLYRGVVWRVDSPSPLLTFDDGPTPGVTEQILDILDRYGIKATFFMLGEKAERYPELVAQVRAAGHTIGNHTYSHLRGTRTPTRQYLEEIERTQNVLEGEKFFRPPYGRIWPWQRWALHRRGYTIWLWDIIPYDYDPRYSADDIVTIVRRYARPGSIILLHDSEKSAPRLLSALPTICQSIHS